MIIIAPIIVEQDDLGLLIPRKGDHQLRATSLRPAHKVRVVQVYIVLSLMVRVQKHCATDVIVANEHRPCARHTSVEASKVDAGVRTFPERSVDASQMWPPASCLTEVPILITYPHWTRMRVVTNVASATDAMMGHCRVSARERTARHSARQEEWRHLWPSGNGALSHAL